VAALEFAEARRLRDCGRGRVGVVHPTVDPTRFARDAVEHAFEVVVPADVSDFGHHLAGEFESLGFAAHLFEAGRRAATDHHVGARAREGQRDRASERAASARDPDAAVRKIDQR